MSKYQEFLTVHGQLIAGTVLVIAVIVATIFIGA